MIEKQQAFLIDVRFLSQLIREILNFCSHQATSNVSRMMSPIIKHIHTNIQAFVIWLNGLTNLCVVCISFIAASSSNQQHTNKHRQNNQMRKEKKTTTTRNNSQKITLKSYKIFLISLDHTVNRPQHHTGANFNDQKSNNQHFVQFTSKYTLSVEWIQSL